VFKPSFFLKFNTLAAMSPTLEDFVGAAGDRVKTYSLKGTEELDEGTMQAGAFPNGNPLPCGRFWRCGEIIPPLLVPCFEATDPRVCLHECLTKVKKHVDDDLNDVGSKMY
jgi:hypothetical protein